MPGKDSDEGGRGNHFSAISALSHIEDLMTIIICKKIECDYKTLQ